MVLGDMNSGDGLDARCHAKDRRPRRAVKASGKKK
jgi:hypothetical protein